MTPEISLSQSDVVLRPSLGVPQTYGKIIQYLSPDILQIFVGLLLKVHLSFSGNTFLNSVRVDRKFWPNRNLTGLGSFWPEPDRITSQNNLTGFDRIGRINRFGRIFTGFFKLYRSITSHKHKYAWQLQFWYKSWRVRAGHVPTFLGWFWVRVHNFAHVRPRSKNVAKNQNLDKILNVSSFDLSRKNKQFKKQYQDRMKSKRVMPIRRSRAMW